MRLQLGCTQLCTDLHENTSQAAPRALAHRLLATANRLLNPKWPTGSWKRINLRLLNPPINFCKISFCVQPFLLWEPQESKMATRGPKMADGVYPQCLLSNVFWQDMFKRVSYSSTLRSLRRSHQLYLNKLFGPSAPSMRKVDDGKRNRKEIIMLFLVATNIALWFKMTQKRPKPPKMNI